MELEYTIEKPGDLVFDYLSDMQKFVSVHPIIYRVEPLGNNQYLLYERLKFLFLPYSFTYIATVENSRQENKIRISATVKKLVHIKMEFLIEQSGNLSKVKEKVEFKSFLPVHPFMRRIFRAQHGLMFSNIQKLS